MRRKNATSSVAQNSVRFISCFKGLIFTFRVEVTPLWEFPMNLAGRRYAKWVDEFSDFLAHILLLLSLIISPSLFEIHINTVNKTYFVLLALSVALNGILRVEKLKPFSEARSRLRNLHFRPHFVASDVFFTSGISTVLIWVCSRFWRAKVCVSAMMWVKIFVVSPWRCQFWCCKVGEQVTGWVVGASQN